MGSTASLLLLLQLHCKTLEMAAVTTYVADRLLKVMVIRWYLHSVVMVLVRIFMDHRTSFTLVCSHISLIIVVAKFP